MAMTIKKFSFVQLINVIDGRMVNEQGLDDAQHILNHLFNANIPVHEVPGYIKLLKDYNPWWLLAIRHEYHILQLMHEKRKGFFDFRSKRQIFLDFVKLIEREFNYTFDCPRLKEFE